MLWAQPGGRGSAVTRGVLAAPDLTLSGAVARESAGRDIGEVLSLERAGGKVAASVAEALCAKADVLVDYPLRKR